MIYAQINSNVVVNIIDVEDPSLVSLFSEGFDLCIRVDNSPIVPSIGWTYSPVTHSFSAPLTLSQSLMNDYAVFGNQIILQWNALNLDGNIYTAGQTIAFLSYVGQLYQLLSLGYLDDANDAISSMLSDVSTAKTDLCPFLTDDILYNFQNQIQDFLAFSP